MKHDPPENIILVKSATIKIGGCYQVAKVGGSRQAMEGRLLKIKQYLRPKGTIHESLHIR